MVNNNIEDLSKNFFNIATSSPNQNMYHIKKGDGINVYVLAFQGWYSG